MKRSRHVGSAISLLVAAVVVGYLSLDATGMLLWYAGDDLAIENVQAAQTIHRGIALALLAGGLSLLTGTTFGLWLGRVAAAVMVLVGVYLVWWVMFIDEIYVKAMSYLSILPQAALLAGAGVSILWVLRGRPTG
jgi:hypothetical protein